MLESIAKNKNKILYFNMLIIKNISDNKTVAHWKKNRIVTSDEEISYIMDNYFTELTQHVNLKLDIIKQSLSPANLERLFGILKVFRELL